MTVLLIINGPAYGSDETLNAVRLAVALSKREGVAVQLFLMGDAVTCAVNGQKTPDGYYTLDRMLAGFVRNGGEIGCCGTCLDARGLAEDQLIDGAPRSTVENLATWTIEADKVLVF